MERNLYTIVDDGDEINIRVATTLDWRWKDETGTGKATTVYTIVDDGDEINIRAVITQRWELAELVTKLQQRVDGLPVNLTTMIEAIVPTEGSETFEKVMKAAGYEFDNKDTPRKELSNER